MGILGGGKVLEEKIQEMWRYFGQSLSDHAHSFHSALSKTAKMFLTREELLNEFRKLSEENYRLRNDILDLKSKFSQPVQMQLPHQGDVIETVKELIKQEKELNNLTKYDL